MGGGGNPTNITMKARIEFGRNVRTKVGTKEKVKSEGRKDKLGGT